MFLVLRKKIDGYQSYQWFRNKLKKKTVYIYLKWKKWEAVGTTFSANDSS